MFKLWGLKQVRSGRGLAGGGGTTGEKRRFTPFFYFLAAESFLLEGGGRGRGRHQPEGLPTPEAASAIRHFFPSSLHPLTVRPRTARGCARCGSWGGFMCMYGPGGGSTTMVYLQLLCLPRMYAPVMGEGRPFFLSSCFSWLLYYARYVPCLSVPFLPALHSGLSQDGMLGGGGRAKMARRMRASWHVCSPVSFVAGRQGTERGGQLCFSSSKRGFMSMTNANRSRSCRLSAFSLPSMSFKLARCRAAAAVETSPVGRGTDDCAGRRGICRVVGTITNVKREFPWVLPTCGWAGRACCSWGMSLLWARPCSGLLDEGLLCL
ncbi:hypothetical protein B0H67DRAFT_1067 [Lasiosphaeris hirsuta]|uniref:Uncharacterized protein n=1 Tax=Lasiosphaeris hirsuta TaxID=260670 RepID=A0AA40B885_9PEZI|nr:hypothetical protein B0H67DRAFT_1067 [Lasiosphaeris hirsuta]